MAFVIASIKLVLVFAWLIMLYFGAFALALYIIGALIEMIGEAREHGAMYLVRNPLLTLRNAHHGGVALLRPWRYLVAA